jgi:hypothetical protein
LFQHLIAIYGCQFFFCPDPGILKKIGDQHLHPHRRLHDIVDVFVSFTIKIATVLLLEQSYET